MEELYLNDILIELPKNSIAITLQVNDLGELVNRQSTFSNSIEVPKTDNNVATMDLLGVVGNTSLKPYRKIKAKYVVSGVELVSNGNVEIVETSKSYKLRIYDGAVAFMDEVKNKLFTNLNFSSYNHNLTMDSYIASFSKTSGYIYADGIFYRDFYLNAYNLKAPSFYLHTLFNEVITQNGYTWEGSISTNPDFLKKVVTVNKGYDNNITFASETLLVNINEGNSYNISSGTPISNEIPIATIPFTGSDVYRLSLTMSIVSYSGTHNLLVFKDGNFIDAVFLGEGGQTSTSKTIDINIVGSGDLTFKLVYNTSYNGTNHIANFSYSFLGFVNKVTINPININFNDLFVNVNQQTFIKDVMNWFGLTFKQVRNTKHLIFKSNKKLLVDRTGAEDWDDKFININSESYDSGYAIKNRFAYKYDSGVEPFADGFMNIDNEVLDDEKTVYQTMFTAPSKIGIHEQMNLWEIKKIDNVDQRIPKVDSLSMFNILYSNAPFSVGVDGSVGGKQLSEGTIVPILSLQPMIHTIINSYKEFKVLLDRYKKVTADFNLSLMDVYNIDFFKLKYLKGKYYYLNKIINFMPQKISKCELIEATDISLLSTVDLIPPTNILSIWVTLISDTSMTLNWSESFDDTSVTYEVYKNDVLITTQSGRTYPFTGLLASTTYSFKVRAKDTGNNLSAFIVTTATTTAVPADLTPPAMPTGVVVTLVTSSSLRLSWNANADSDIYGYRIYKNGVADLFISHPTILYNYTNLLSNTNYQFRLSAVDTSNNESALTSIVSATTLINYTSFDLDVEGYVTNTNSCSLGFAAGQTKWHNGSGAFPTYGDIVYTTSTGVVVYNGGSLWYKIQGGVYGISINIGTNGVINDLYNCTSGGEEEM